MFISVRFHANNSNKTSSRTFERCSRSKTYQKHSEENESPEYRKWKFEDQIWISEEDKTRAGINDVLNCRFLNMSHVTQNRKYQDAGQQTSQSVHNTSDDSVSKNKVYEFVWAFKVSCLIISYNLYPLHIESCVMAHVLIYS